MGNETNQTLIKRARLFNDEKWALDVDARGRYFFYGPDGIGQRGMMWDDLMTLQHILGLAMDHRRAVVGGKKELPE